jgi:hypothetical protein
MKLKPVPAAPDGLDALADVQRAVPLVPGSEEDCCARVLDRTHVGERDEARTWLTFLRALDLARETDAGFVRERGEPEQQALAEAFRAQVFAADDVLDALADADGPLTADEVFERVEPTVPTWEREKNPGGWRDTWRERVRRLLDWAVLLGLAEREDGGYASA